MALIKRNTAYSLNDIVNTKYGTKLKCTTAGTTSTDPLILNGTSSITDGTVVWEVQEESGGSGQGLVDWQANTSYSVGDIVVYDDKIYKCTTAHTSASTFDNTKFTEISAGGIEYWVANTEYYLNDIVIEDDKIYKCTTAHTSTSIFDESKWTEISPGIASSVYATTTTLWSGAYNTVTAGTSFTLSDDYDNYDEILLMQEGQVLRSLVPSISSGFGYDGDGGQLGTNYSAHIIINFSGTTATPVIWQYGSGLTSATVYIVGRNYIKCEGYYVTKDVLWSGNENTATPTGTTLSLTNNYTDYDYLLVYFGYNTTIEDTCIKNIGLFDCSSPYSNFEYVFSSRINSSTFSTVYADISFSGATWKIIKYVTTISDVFINKIVGIKFLPNPNNYSTTEKEIGTWIDGKKLYQVTLSGTTDSSTNTTTRYNELPYNDLTPYNIDTVVDITGGCYNTNYSFTPFGKFQLAYTSQFSEDNRSVLNAYTEKDTSDNNKLKLYITSGNWYAGLDYYVTLKYTKV